MNVKKIKRICGVRGCKNTEVFAISKSKDMGNSVIACKDCLKEALASIENYVEPVKVKREQKPLFYHPELDVTLSSVADDEPKPNEVIENVTEDSTISVAEDTVTIPEVPEEKETITTTTPAVKLPTEATTTTTVKRKTNKKK